MHLWSWPIWQRSMRLTKETIFFLFPNSTFSRMCLLQHRKKLVNIDCFHLLRSYTGNQLTALFYNITITNVYGLVMNTYSKKNSHQLYCHKNLAKPYSWLMNFSKKVYRFTIFSRVSSFTRSSGGKKFIERSKNMELTAFQCEN